MCSCLESADSIPSYSSNLQILRTLESSAHYPAWPEWRRCSGSGQGDGMEQLCLLTLAVILKSHLGLLHTLLAGQSPFWLGFRKTALWLCLPCLTTFFLTPLNWFSMHWPLTGLIGNSGAATMHCRKPGLISMMSLLLWGQSAWAQETWLVRGKSGMDSLGFVCLWW